jgi:hypothetical protein
MVLGFLFSAKQYNTNQLVRARLGLGIDLMSG